MPKSLCPYFWSLIIMYVFIVPYFIITIPYFIFNKKVNDSFLAGIFGSAVIYVFLFGIFSMIASLVYLFIGQTPQSVFWSQVFSTGVIFWFVILFFLFHRLFEYLWDRSLKKPEKKDTDKKLNMITEFVKAKYNKYCPKISWK